MASHQSIGIALSGAALLLGFFTLQSIMWAVWGAPTHWVQYLALLGCVGLFATSILWLIAGRIGRTAPILSVAAMGTLFIPAAASLVPEHDTITSPTAVVLIITYFVAAGIVLLLPPRRSWRSWLFAVSILASLGYASHTFYARWRDGEFDRPAFAFYSLTPLHAADSRKTPDRPRAAGTLQVYERQRPWLAPELERRLAQAGVSGKLKWLCASGSRSNDHRIVVISVGSPAVKANLHYPRHGHIAYIFDGVAWHTIPDDAATYESHAVLETEGNVSRLRQKSAAGGGESESYACTWR